LAGARIVLNPQPVAGTDAPDYSEYRLQAGRCELGQLALRQRGIFKLHILEIGAVSQLFLKQIRCIPTTARMLKIICRGTKISEVEASWKNAREHQPF
jgi:hypothetical protein